MKIPLYIIYLFHLLFIIIQIWFGHHLILDILFIIIVSFLSLGFEFFDEVFYFDFIYNIIVIIYIVILYYFSSIIKFHY